MQLESRRVYTGRVVRVDVDTVPFPDGSTGELEIIRHPGAAAIVPCASDPQGDPDPTILLIRQYRYAAGGLLWEIPAGTLNPAEDPEACARRELLEEAGVTAARLQRLTSIWTTPGFTDEVIHLYLATGLTAGTPSRERDELSRWCHSRCRRSWPASGTARSGTQRPWWLSFIWPGSSSGCSNPMSPDEDGRVGPTRRWIGEGVTASWVT